MRVLVVSNDASLAVALSLMSENREVLSVRTAGEISSDMTFSSTVVDVGTTSDGLEVVRELTDAGVAAPVFLLGDVEASVPHPGVHVLVRPFTLAQLDERLSAVTARQEEVSDQPFEGSTNRCGGAQPGGHGRRDETGRAPARTGADSDDRPQETTRAAATVGAQAFITLDPPIGFEGDEPGLAHIRGSEAVAPAGPAPEAVVPAGPAPEAVVPARPAPEAVAPRLAAGLSPRHPKPDVHPRFRSRRVGASEGPHTPSASTLRTVLALARELEALLEERPEILDRRMVANGALDEIDRQLRPDAAVVWVARDDRTYEAYATRGLEGAVGIRVPEEQSLFLSFKGDVDSVLVTPLDISQRPVSGIPGLIGESLVAGAMRLGQTLLAIVVVTGSGFTATDRDRLAFLAARAAPDFAVAGLIERLRRRTFDSATSDRSV